MATSRSEHHVEHHVAHHDEHHDEHHVAHHDEHHDADDSNTAPARWATVADSLTVHGDLTPQEFESLLDHWSKLDVRLRSFGPGAVRLDLYVKDRDTPSQHLTLETTVTRWPVLIATSDDADLAHALNVVRDEMIRLITDAKDRHSPSRHR